MNELVSPEAISRYLGGKKLLGGSITDRRELAQVTSRGIPYASAFYLLGLLGATQKEMAGLLGINIRTLNRNRQSGARMDPGASDRAYRVARILALATEVLEDEEAARRWLHEPQMALGGETPLHLVALGGSGPEEVEELLMRMEYGIYA